MLFHRSSVATIYSIPHIVARKNIIKIPLWQLPRLAMESEHAFMHICRDDGDMARRTEGSSGTSATPWPASRMSRSGPVR
jgi:hypothetical protein